MQTQFAVWEWQHAKAGAFKAFIANVAREGDAQVLVREGGTLGDENPFLPRGTVRRGYDRIKPAP
jgi:hypothetical protein